MKKIERIEALERELAAIRQELALLRALQHPTYTPYPNYPSWLPQEWVGNASVH